MLLTLTLTITKTLTTYVKKNVEYMEHANMVRDRNNHNLKPNLIHSQPAVA